MVPGDPGIGPVAGTYGTGDCPGAERKEREDTFSRAEILNQMEPHAKEYAPQEHGDPSGMYTVNQTRREVKESACNGHNKQDTGDGVGQALVRRIQDRMPGACIDPAHERSTYPPGKLDDEPRERAEGKMFWPGHMNVGQEDTSTGTGNNQHHQEEG